MDDGARRCSCSVGFQPTILRFRWAQKNAAKMAALQEGLGGWRDHDKHVHRARLTLAVNYMQDLFFKTQKLPLDYFAFFWGGAVSCERDCSAGALWRVVGYFSESHLSRPPSMIFTLV